MQIKDSIDTATQAKLFHVLGDKTRLEILLTLLNRRGLCVSEITEESGISISGTSQHLRQLEQSGLALRERHGQKICYLPNEDSPQAQALFNCLEQLNKEEINE